METPDFDVAAKANGDGSSTIRAGSNVMGAEIVCVIHRLETWKALRRAVVHRDGRATGSGEQMITGQSNAEDIRGSSCRQESGLQLKLQAGPWMSNRGWLRHTIVGNRVGDEILL